MRVNYELLWVNANLCLRISYKLSNLQSNFMCFLKLCYDA
jgi:hypothetical protein